MGRRSKTRGSSAKRSQRGSKKQRGSSAKRSRRGSKKQRSQRGSSRGRKRNATYVPDVSFLDNVDPAQLRTCYAMVEADQKKRQYIESFGKQAMPTKKQMAQRRLKEGAASWQGFDDTVSNVLGTAGFVVPQALGYGYLSSLGMSQAAPALYRRVADKLRGRRSGK